MTQFNIFINFILTGFIIGILYDVFRILRKSFKTLDIVTYIQDIIFWILTGIILLYSIFTFNNGELRGYIFIGILSGVVLYMLLISKYFICVTVKFIKFIKKIIFYPINILHKFILKYIFRPIHRIITKINIKLPKIKLKNRENDNLSNKI